MIFSGKSNRRATSEAALQLKVLRYLRLNDGCRVFRVAASSTRGAPDIVCCFNGKFVAIELKSGNYNAKLSANQKLIKDDIERCGGTFLCIRSLNELERWFEQAGRLA